MPASTLAPAIMMLLLGSSSPAADPVLHGAFNTYDALTFADSTCEPLAVEIPQGIFASPDGRADAAGTEDDPLDLATALTANDLIQDGDTLWLMEGVYVGSFYSSLSGSEGNPISVRPYPGKRVILESPARQEGENGSSTLFVDAGWTNYYDLEIMSNAMDRTSLQDTSSPTDINLQGGVTVGAYHYASHTKIINCIVHDTAGGLSSFSASTNSEMYGNIIYNNGWTAPGRGHGHGMYTQNVTGYKKITNNIIFFGFATGIHAYVEGSPKLENYDVQNNAWFLTGASDPRASQKKDNCLIGGYQPVTNLLLKNNKGFSDNGRGTRLGYGGSVTGQSAVLQDNYLVENLWIAGEWDQLDVMNTSVFHGITGSSQSYINDLGDNLFEESDPVSGKKIFVDANAYDPRRARVIVYNFDGDETASVDLSSVLKTGEAYRVHSVFDLFGEPIQSGLYDGTSVSIPMGSVAPPQPNGVDGIGAEDDPGTRFGVFIVTHAGCL